MRIKDIYTFYTTSFMSFTKYTGDVEKFKFAFLILRETDPQRYSNQFIVFPTRTIHAPQLKHYFLTGILSLHWAAY